MKGKQLIFIGVIFMGNCKDNLTPTEKKDSKLGFFPKRKPKVEEDAPKKFADMILKAEEIINQLVDEKTKDIEIEKGQEDKNRKKQGLLKLMRFHIQEVIDAAQEYHEV